MMQQSKALLALENLTVARKGRIIVSDLSLTLGKGIFALWGSNGAGKTSLLSTLAGVLPCASGTVRIDGVELTADPVAAKRKLSFLPEGVSVYPFMTGDELLTFVTGVRGCRDSARLDTLVDRFQLNAYRYMRFDKMSLGTQRKFMLIAVLACQTNLYLLDEPTNALDARSLEVLAELIREASRHSLVILSCHDRNFLNLLEHRTLVLHDGHITQDPRLISGGPRENSAMDPAG